MAFTPYHKITGSTGETIQLIAPGDGANNIKSIMIANIHATADATVSLYIFQGTTKYYIISTVAIPSDTSLLLDDSNTLSFNNSAAGYGLGLTVGSSDTIDVLINK